MAKKKGLFVKDAKGNERAFAKEFIRSPEDFAKKHGLDPDNLECPEEVHAAFSRGKAFAEEVERAELSPDKQSLDQMDRAATTHLGEDYDVKMIPFGLKFKERIRDMGEAGWTATGSGSITFLDSDSDVDG